jgi:peptidoglycan LD-endopeptidase LytH
MPGMTRPYRRLLAVVTVVAFALPAGVSPAHSVSEEEVLRAKQERDRAAAELAAALGDLDEAIVAFHAITEELDVLTFRMGRLQGQIDLYEERSALLAEAVKERAVEAYMNSTGGEAAAARLASPELAQRGLIAREVLALTTESDFVSLGSLGAVTADLDRLRSDLDGDTIRVAQLQVDQAAIVERMNELFDEKAMVAGDAQAAFQEANAAYQEQLRREEAARRVRDEIRAALGAPAEGVPMWVTPGFICPIAGFNWFIDTWHAPRSGGRVHKGTDMFAARGTPLVAVGDGTVRKSYDGLGGYIVWLYADHGVNYFYSHLDGYPAGLVNGQRVSRGQVIGYVGDTGNPAPGAYHLHFGVYPGGIMAVNPYPTAREVCS